MRVSVSVRVLAVVIVLLGATAAHLQAQSAPSPQQLEKWLREYPEADSNADGVLTADEADAYRRKLVERSRGRDSGPDYDFRTEFTFAEMSDGVQIALAVGFPRSWDPSAQPQNKWPALLEMMGYPGSTAPSPPRDFGDQYVTVRASVRGAGASGGVIRAVSERTGRDGYEVIENWIVKQPWSNGKVALHGHSWGGLTGLMIAATNPPHLKAVAVSGLFDDVYRDIGCPGGIRNCGFPVAWMVSLYKPTGPFDSGEAAIQARGMTRAEYDRIVAARPPWDLTHSLLWQSLHSRQDAAEFASASPGSFAAGVRAPIHIMHAYQDEQTGPSGVWLWQCIPNDVPKHLVLTNGDHGDVRRFDRQRRRWLDFWTLRDGQGDAPEFTDPARRVEVHFETPATSQTVNPPLTAADFPLPDTQWTRYYLHDDHLLQAVPPADAEAADTYRVTLAPSEAEQGVHYLLDFDEPTAICGPVCVSLWLNCSTVDTDLYAVVTDVAPDGTVQMLQRGLLRASHRALDKEKSCWVTEGGETLLARPRHTHRDIQPVIPGTPVQLDIEVYPVGHVFRAEHKLGLWIGVPPAGDPVTRDRDGQPSYRYESAMPPANVAILRTAEHPSSILLPLLPKLPPLGDRPLPPGQQAGIHVR